MVSIKDIAKALGVSPSSVSFVLNGKAKEKRISGALADRITATAAEMGYHPNRVAVSLRTGKSKTIGLIVENIANNFFSTLAKTIEDEARKLRYNVVYCSTENEAFKGREMIQMLYNQQVDGYLITPAEGMEPDVQRLLSQNKPVVLMDRRFEGVNVPSVLVDNFLGMKEGVEYLVAKGARRIGFITVDLNLFQMAERERAYREVHGEQGLSYNKKNILRLGFHNTKDKSVAQICAFIRQTKGLDALVFATNYLGIYGLLSIKQLGLRIPADIKMLCFDDNDIFELYEPGITVIRQPIREIAETAVTLLVTAMSGGEPVPAEEILLPAQLLIRGSI